MDKLMRFCMAGTAVLLLAAPHAGAEVYIPKGVEVPLGQNLVQSHPPVAAEIILEGVWKFKTDPDNTGVQQGWQKPGFDSNTWQTLNAPATWEDQGVTAANPKWTQDDLNQPYSGYAWYRKSVTIPESWRGKPVYLNAGQIDDFDWAYVNGQLVGQTVNWGEPTDNIRRSYRVPDEVVRFGGQNVVAIRVLDVRGVGGIVGSPLSVTSAAPGTAGGGLDPLPEDGISRNPGQVEFGRSIRVAEGQVVSEAVAIGGSIDVYGEVQTDAVAIGGSVKVHDGGRVGGDAVSIGGRLNIADGGTVAGDRVSVGMGAPWDNWQIFGDGFSFFGFSLLMSLIVSLTFALIALLVAALFPERMETVAAAALGQPGYSFVYAVVGLLGAAVIAVVLTITCIGIPLLPVEAVILLVMWLAGAVAARLLVGRKIAEAAGRPDVSTIVAVLIGSVVFAVVELVPLLGSIVTLILTLLGFGAVIVTGFGKSHDWINQRGRQQTAGARGYPPAPSAPSAPPAPPAPPPTG